MVSSHHGNARGTAKQLHKDKLEVKIIIYQIEAAIYTSTIVSHALGDTVLEETRRRSIE